MGGHRSDGHVEPHASCPGKHDSGAATPKYRNILESKKPKVDLRSYVRGVLTYVSKEAFVADIAQMTY